MSDEQEDFKKKLAALKPKKKNIDVAEGLLSDAKSYEGKLMAVQIIAEREKSRVVLLFKKMLQPEPPKKVIEVQKEVPKPPVKKKGFLGK